ncbi:uncharacterized protein LOC118278227 isoform X1 [Spodoptera frugiperda]|uniref:Uncharacterized protein LOC118278227 isoform X1 n=1 Tax=Spodoptera frugiperda TaxID=7108 RepID=A0A9R0DHE0_SPOFR|nr:uncharacterized protein LOC118278227 isoform X1 [Spodoptera frugiperda]
MDAKDLRTESGVSERNNDGSKYSQSSGIALHCDRNKSYQDIGSNSLGKVEVQNARPCAVIGPDRVVPPPAVSDAYHIKKGPAEPWPCMDNAYRRLPEYPHKLANFQNPTRNISPRQTFQENMQRIMVPPTYNSIKINDDTNYAQISDRNNSVPKNIKLNMPPEAKFCDVPYAVNPTSSELKNVRNSEMCLPNVNPTVTRTAPHGWPPGSVNLRSTRMYSAPELYQYQEYPSCAGPRPVVPRPHRTVPEEQGYVYADPYYQEGNIRFKPYPSVKERYPQQRYEYIGNYSNPFHPPPGFPAHKYELQKSIPPHPYPPYPPIKYLDSRVAEPVMEGYQRTPQGNYNIQYRNQVIHPNYGPVISNCPQNKMHSYPPDAHMKTIPSNKLPYDNSTKAYIEYDNNRPKIYPTTESYFVNEMPRMPMKSQVIMPNYSTINVHNLPPNPYYKKDTQQLKNYEHMAHFRNMDPNINVHNPMSRHAPVFSPNTLAISPTDSNTSNDTTQTLGTSQEDCGYVSQSSTASVRSIDSGVNRIPNEYLRKYYDNRYGPMVRTSPMMSKSQLNSNNNMSKDKKQIDVRQFLQMWNEGDEEQEENGSKEIIIQTGSSEKTNFNKTNDGMNNQEQLYVLGLVNVPSEELAKYEHIQKVSKLPENIKGYNSIELLNQFEEVIESSNMSNYKTPASKDYHMAMKVHQKQVTGVIPPRPVSPLDVEAKISQSVIHKEVGCNFEIKPCSPKMLNVEVAAPVQNILAERSIEKVANPVINKSPMLNGINENIDCNIMKRGDHRMNMNENIRIPSCKMINNTQFSNTNPMDPIKSSYSLQDLESNSGLCLASLPRLDNDIELNFPEVNQQFINANKGDNNILSSSMRDLPTLEVLDPPENQMKDKYDHTNSSRAENDVAKSPCIMESETEFSKLSKYRKTKINSSEPKEILIQHNVNAIRTDSVIIKNPENIKKYEDNLDISLKCSDKNVVDVQQAPINLTAQENLSIIVNTSQNIHSIEAERNTLLPTEIAIDFSLNKADNLNNTESIETKMESPVIAPTHVEETCLNTFINREVSSDPISLLPALTEQHDDVVKDDKGDRGCDLSNSEGNDNISITNNENSERKEKTSTSDDDHKILLNDLDENKVNDPVTEHKSPDENESPNLPETEMPDSDNSTVLISDHNTKEIRNDLDTGDTPSELSKESDYMFPEIHSEYTENLTQNSNEIYELNTNDKIAAKDEHDEIMENCENHDDLIDELSNSIPNETELGLDTSLNNELNEISDTRTYPEIREKTPYTSPLHQIDNKQFQLNEDLCHDRSENKEQTKEMITEEIPKDYEIDHTDGNIENDNSLQLLKDDKIENDNSSHLPTKLSSSSSDLEEDLNKTNNEVFLDTPTCTKQSDLYDCDQTINGDLGDKLYKPIPRDFLYFNKELYSPWIQKLLTFSEGNCNNVTPENVVDSSDDFLYDSMESLNTSTVAVVKQNDCDLDMSKSPFKDDEPMSEDDEPPFDDDKPPFENDKLPCEDDIPPYKDDKPPLEDDNPLFEDDKPPFENDKPPCEDDKPPYKDDKPSFEGYNSPFEDNNPPFEDNNPPFEDNNPLIEDNNSPIEDDNPPFEDDKPPVEDDTPPFEDNTPLFEDDKPSFQDDKPSFQDDKPSFQDDKPSFQDDKPPFQDDQPAFEDRTPSFEDNNSPSKDDNPLFEEDKPTFEDDNPSFKDETPPLEDDMSKSVTEDLDQDNHSDIEMETDNASVINSPVLDDYIDESVTNQVDLNSQIDSEDNFKMEENSVAPEVVADDEPCLNNNDVTESCIESDIEENTLADENVNASYEDQINSDVDNQCEVASEVSELDTSKEEEVAYESIQCPPDQCNDQNDDRKQNTTLETNDSENVRFPSNEIPYKKCNRLKRSLSDSALNMYNNEEQTKQENEDNVQFIWPFKRRKVNKVNNEFIAQNLCNIIHNNRRNSVSSFYNEENVSFCIFIDNSCIITEEENEETEKVCYTELAEDCLHDDLNTETLSEDISTPQPEHTCDYSDSVVVDCEEEKALEESWVEDVGCEETIIDDDVAEDIEICEPSSPKDVILSDNEESGVFSSSEHTDKVKSIYGDKMCSDDALFVETLYNTPQMDVNKTLYSRETRVSEEYDRYYDNYSLEKMLSESNEPPLSPYVPPYIDKILNSGKLNPKETPEDKENVSEGTSSPFQNKSNALDIVVDINVDKNERENRHSIEFFAKTQEDAVHSCESSVDDVFTYNQKDDDAVYTSSSPEVSSTTSEEKNSGILLKITNYKGSRISQINDISSVNKRSSCKFTEEKEYLHSHANFSSHRPLLTKAAQKYIPPLKESIRDLKVKLSLPQHSLMKLKQLKMSKDEPKLSKQNVSTPRIPKKPKPKFEDVLKSIDEMQFKMHKEKTKKPKKSIPKVVIKKNQNGSHYASTSNKDDFNPDLTGRKWQPWVFIEKNHFIDKMATRNKTKAIYSHRKRTYVLAEKFQKYKSASSAKFVISPPISDNSSSSGLKYTIRLKHNY